MNELVIKSFDLGQSVLGETGEVTSCFVSTLNATRICVGTALVQQVTQHTDTICWVDGVIAAGMCSSAHKQECDIFGIFRSVDLTTFPQCQRYVRAKDCCWGRCYPDHTLKKIVNARLEHY